MIVMKSTPNFSAIEERVSSSSTVYRKGAEAVALGSAVKVGVMLCVNVIVGVLLAVDVIVGVGVSLANSAMLARPPALNQLNIM